MNGYTENVGKVLGCEWGRGDVFPQELEGGMEVLVTAEQENCVPLIPRVPWALDTATGGRDDVSHCWLLVRLPPLPVAPEGNLASPTWMGLRSWLLCPRSLRPLPCPQRGAEGYLYDLEVN